MFNTPYYELGLWCFCDPDFHLYGYTGLSSFVVFPSSAVFDTSESLLLMHDSLAYEPLTYSSLGYVPSLIF